MVIHFYVFSLCGYLFSYYVFPLTTWLCEWRWYMRILQLEVTHGDPFLYAFTIWLFSFFHVFSINYVLLNGDDIWWYFNEKWLIVIHYLCFHYVLIYFHYAIYINYVVTSWKRYMTILQWGNDSWWFILYAFIMYLFAFFYSLSINYVVT